MSKHDKYSELCALLAIGQLSQSEDAELRTHLERCRPCQATARDYAQIVTREMPLSSSLLRQWWQGPRVHGSANMREQFLRHARSEGVRFSAEVNRQPPFIASLGMPSLKRFYPAGVMLGLMIIAAVVGWSLRPGRVSESTNTHEAALTLQGTPAREAALIKELADLKQANASLLEEIARSQEVRATQGRDLVVMHSEVLTKDQRIDQLDRLLNSAQSKADVLQASLKDAAAKNGDFEARVNETSRQLATARAEMENLRAARSDGDATLVAQQFQIKALSEKLRLQNASLDMDRQLLAASRDVSEMMGARNLYITDVRDFDTRGNPKKVFGRIFYTEGRSLVFYAFDLADRRVENVKHSFQAWGHQETDPNSAKSLGIFYVDDKAQRRWVLKVDDPALLAHIDTVFVTVEPPGGEKKPTGQKLLYAFLNAPPNHP